MWNTITQVPITGVPYMFWGYFFFRRVDATKMVDEIVVRPTGGATKWLGDENAKRLLIGLLIGLHSVAHNGSLFT